MLRPGGTALVVAPARSGTFHRFASMCRTHFRVAIVEKYDQAVDQHVQKVSVLVMVCCRFVCLMVNIWNVVYY